VSSSDPGGPSRSWVVAAWTVSFRSPQNQHGEARSLRIELPRDPDPERRRLGRPPVQGVGGVPGPLRFVLGVEPFPGERQQLGFQVGGREPEPLPRVRPNGDRDGPPPHRALGVALVVVLHPIPTKEDRERLSNLGEQA